MVNLLNLLFGPSLPESLDLVPIGFVSSPVSDPDSAIAVLSSDRYITTNYSTFNQFELFAANNAITGVILYEFGGSSLNDSGTANSGFAGGGVVGLEAGERLMFNTLHSPIQAKGIKITRANSWFPVIEGGVVWRKHTIQAAEILEAGTIPTSAQGSWLIRAGLQEGDDVYLIYSVPEVRYGPTQSGTYGAFASSGFQLREVVEATSPASPNQIRYDGDLKVLTRILVNNRQVFPTASEIFDGTSTHTYIRGIDQDLKIITVSDSLNPDDDIKITYLAYANYYEYSGYRDWQGNWYPYDCNPEYGHIIRNPSTGDFQSSAIALLDQTTLYLMPSAYMKVNFETPTDSTDQLIVRCTFDSAFNWGETHFVRHVHGQDPEDINARQQDGPSNTWGYAVFGRNYYDEETFVDLDVYNSSRPSMMRISKIILGAPASVESVAIADIRQRGGGVPEDFPEQAVSTNEEGIDTLRGYYDLGIWDGAAIKEGGVVSVRLATSLLDTYSSEDIYQIVRDRVPPGIDIQISFVDNP